MKRHPSGITLKNKNSLLTIRMAVFLFRKQVLRIVFPLQFIATSALVSHLFHTVSHDQD